MKVNKYDDYLTLRGENGDTLRIGYDNRGEPYRAGVSFDLRDADHKGISVFVEDHEIRALRDLLNRLYPK